MKFPHLPKVVALAGCLAVCLPAALAQNSILLIGNSQVQPTASTTSPANPYTFQSTIQELSCQTLPIYANISSQPSAQQYSNQLLIVLDTIQVTVTPIVPGQISSPTTANVCPSEDGFTPVCFNPGQVGIHGEFLYPTPEIGQNLDCTVGQNSSCTLPNTSGQTYSDVYGVPPISIASMLTQGTQSVEFDLQNTLNPAQSDTGNSSLYLNTNCTSLGVSGPATVINNPPPGVPQNPVPETFAFNGGVNQGINFQYTVPPQVGDLTGITEHLTDNPIDPATFDSFYTYGTSFSTSTCFLHAGELLPNSNPACKMYTLLCSVGTNPTQSGALCPASAASNEVFGEAFDPPASLNGANLSPYLQDIATPLGTYHTGVGMLMGPDTWTTGSTNGCQYTPGSLAAEAQQMCPQNLLYNFYGPGSSNSEGRGSNVNSTFITVTGVPMPLTTVTLTNSTGTSLGVGAANGYWTNTTSPYLQLSSTPPLGVSQVSNTVLPGASSFVAAPIQNISYGLTGPGVVPPAPGSEPIATDTTLTSSTACPTQGSTYTAAPFTAPLQPVTLGSGDGTYTVHYYAQDCAGTQELEFLLNSQVNPPSWYTTFYSYPINLDTNAPTVAVALSPTGGSYTYGQSVSANFSCSDGESGLASCGGTTYTINNSTVPATGQANSGQLSAPITTTTVGGPYTYKVTATDFAGNTSSQSVNYSVGKATLTVTANNLSMNTGSAVPTLTYMVTGYENGDSASVLSGSPSLSTTAKSSSSAGNYPITITQGTLAATNYNFTFVNGTMSVQAPPSVTIGTSVAAVSGSASGGYTVLVTITNTGNAPANNVQLTSATLGTATPNNAGTWNKVVPTLAAGASTTVTVSFTGGTGANGAGADGAKVAEKFGGTYAGGTLNTVTYSGGTFAYTVKGTVTLP